MKNSLISQRNQLLVKVLSIFLSIDIFVNLLTEYFLMAKLIFFTAFPALLLIVFLVRKSIAPRITMYLISTLFMAILWILNVKAGDYVNLFFFILPPIFSVSYRDWKNILYTTMVSGTLFSYFLLLNGESYYIEWKQIDVYYFLFFFFIYTFLNIYESKFSEGIYSQLINELDHVKQLQRKLQDSENRYKAMVKQSSEGIFAFNPKDQTIVETNERLCQLLGYEEEEFLKLSLNDFIVGDGPGIDENVENVLKKERYVVGERIYRHKKEEFITVDVSATVICLKNERVILVNVRDITRQKEIEQELQQQGRLLKGVVEAMNSLLTNGDHHIAIQKAIEIIGKAVQVDRVYIFENHRLLDSKEFVSSQRYEWARTASLVELNNPSLQNLSFGQSGFSRWYQMLSSGRIIQGSVKNFPENEQLLLESQNIKSLLVVPIFILDEFWGFIGFDDCENEKYWSITEEMILLMAAAGIGGAIRLNLNTKRLQESEMKYRLIADNMSDFVTVLDRDGKVLYASPSHEGAMIKSVSEFEGSYPLNYIHQDDKETVLSVFQDMFTKGKELQIEFRWRIGDQWFRLEARGKPVVEENGKIQSVVVAIRNITDRVKMEETIRKTSARLEALISHLPYGILAEDRENRLILLNEQFREIFSIPFFSENLYGIKSDFVFQQGKNIFLEKELYDKRKKEILKKRQRVLNEDWFLQDGRIISRDAIPIFVNGEFDGFLWQFKDVTEQKRLEKELKQASLIDGLTKISNRRFFDEMITREWSRCTRASQPLSLIMIDIDFFKKYNDTYGHLKGDECIIQVAQWIKDTLYRPADIVCRYGGEEFAVILPETDQNEGLKIAEKIRTAIESLKISHSASDASPYVTCSLGIASVIPKFSENTSELIWMADQALYTSKTKGRNCVNTYNKKSLC